MKCGEKKRIAIALVLTLVSILCYISFTRISKEYVSNTIYGDRYLNITSSYKKRLREIGRQKYKAHETFVDVEGPLDAPHNRSRVRRILAWTGIFGRQNWLPEVITCNGSIQCVGSSDKNDLNRSDAVVFHGRDMDNSAGLQLPSERKLTQRWVLYNMEPPHLTWLDFTKYNGMFNWTASYRVDSDISTKYFLVKRREKSLSEEEFEQLFDGIMRNKLRMAAQATSNCNSRHSNRVAYAKELAKYVAVDRFGACGNKTCVRFTTDCDNRMKSYMFYLATENTNCRDYITEKAELPMRQWSAVPVVMGGGDPGDYEPLMPPGSYIHTAGFPSPKHLAEYLQLLKDNPLLYKEYHRWRKDYSIVSDDFNCNLCRKLHDATLPRKTYRDLYGWFANDACDINN